MNEDTLVGGAGDDLLYGGTDDDVLYGDGVYDPFWGLLGRDALNHGNGDDSLFGGYGNDVLIGGRGNDFLDAGEGNDRLCGGEGNNVLYGGKDSDSFILERGIGKSEIMDYKHGDDRIWFEGRVEGLTFESGGQGTDIVSIYASNGSDLLANIHGVNQTFHVFGFDGSISYS